MMLVALIGWAAGIEGGFELPVVRFEDHAAGAIFSLKATGEKCGFNLSLALAEAFFNGRNPGYSFTAYRGRIGLARSGWRFSPVIEIGPDYCTRRLIRVQETGFALGYSLGIEYRFRHEALLIAPRLSYDGLTDFSVHAGTFDTRLGLYYEFGAPRHDDWQE